MVPHLYKCAFVAPDIKTIALDEINGKKGRRQNPPILARSFSMPLPTIATGSDLDASWSGMGIPSDLAAPSPLLLSAPLLNIERPLKRSRASSFVSPEGSGTSSPVVTARAWNPPLQQEFGEDLCKLLIATSSSWNTAHNPQMRLFIEKWIPGAIVPDRRTLSGPILDREAGKVEEKLKLKLKGRKATFQTDGWKNKAKQAIVATMVSVDFEVSI